MNQSQAIALLPKLRSLNHWMRVLFICLVVFNLVLLAFSLPPFLHGEPDTYHNEHSRSVVGSISQVLLCLGQVFFLSAQLSAPALSVRWRIFMSLGAVLLISSFVSIYISFQLRC
jgi:hypothetical protein